jgi:signal recognition particle receptor subunit beta
MQYRKVVFAGTMGAGKTTAIRALSEIAPMSTEVANRQTELHGKAQTTVALDYGEIALHSCGPSWPVARLASSSWLIIHKSIQYRT